MHCLPNSNLMLYLSLQGSCCTVREARTSALPTSQTQTFYPKWRQAHANQAEAREILVSVAGPRFTFPSMFTLYVLQTESKQLCQQASCLQRGLWSTHWVPTSCSAADPDPWPLRRRTNTQGSYGDHWGIACFFCFLSCFQSFEPSPRRAIVGQNLYFSGSRWF